MTERDAFPSAIAANPDDDAPRLIFSDWLEENGEPDRAEFSGDVGALTFCSARSFENRLDVLERQLRR